MVPTSKLMSKATTLLLGGGGHGRVVLDTLISQGVNVDGVLDPGLPAGATVFGIPVLGGDQLLDGYKPGAIRLANGLGTGRHDVSQRMRLYERYHARGIEFISIRHASAVVGGRVVLQAGAQLMAGAVVQCGSIIGCNCVVNTAAQIDHDCNIGDHVFIGPGAILCGSVAVGRGSFIGAGAVICPGMKIGEEVLVGAGAVVTSNIPDGGFYIGVPARQAERNK